MAVTIDVVQSKAEQVDPIFNGNLVQNDIGKMIVLVLGPSESGPEYFTGVRLVGGGVCQSQTWLRHMFKQFVGKVTLEGFH